MWLIWFATIILFCLVFFSSKREGLTSLQLYNIQNILNRTDIYPDDKIKYLYGNYSEITIVDPPIIDILKDTSTNSEDKINSLQLYLDNLVNDRNNNPKSIYKRVLNKISTDDFYKINNIINNPDFENDTERIFQINALDIQEATFYNLVDINNTSISDQAKISGDGVYTGPTLTSLINQILYGTFFTPVPVNSSSSSSSNSSSSANDTLKKINPF